MSQYSNVFKRVEKKYKLSSKQRSEAELKLLERMNIDDYGRSLITSLYLDTPQRDMIARSVEKPLYKEKIRLRAYGFEASHALLEAFCGGHLVRTGSNLPLSEREVDMRCERACSSPSVEADEIPIFFEIKKKYKGIVYKRRLAMSLPAAMAFICGLSFELASIRWPLRKEGALRMPSTQERQIARELEKTMDRWGTLVPSMAIRCKREAWTLKREAEPESFDPNLRMTFDDELQYLDCLSDNPTWQEIIEPSESILEIKSAGPYPAWLTKTLSANHIYPASFTKYGTAYQLCMKKGASCSIRHSHQSSEAQIRS